MKLHGLIENLDRLIEHYREVVKKKECEINNKYDGSEVISYDEFLEKLKPELTILHQFERIKRFIQPVMRWNELSEYGNIYEIKEFKTMCEDGGFIDYDGHGYYVKNGKESDIMVKPSYITLGFIRDKEFDSIIWYNK